ncbi:MAG: peptidoglycan DD-metalloendopeptidase family protein [Candidatus Magasanikbacteria bacterium]|nr:peptidoglycan DD-metalloendopeptidase family protein [Candidatus Magasanikbacteria bacterium]
MRLVIKAGLLILIGLFITSPIVVFSENVGGNKQEIDVLNQKIAEKKTKIKQLEDSIAAYKKKVDQKRLEAISLSNQIAIFDNRISQVELDIQATEDKLDTLTLEIEALNLAIDDKEKVISRQKRILAELIRAYHEQDGKNYIEIAAAYENFSDFYNQVQYLQTVQNDLVLNVNSLRDARQDLADKKKQIEERKNSYLTFKEELEQKKDDFDEQAKLKQDLLAQTYSSELKFKTLLANLKEQSQAVESEVISIEREVRKKLEKQKQLKNVELEPGGKFSWPTQSRYITTGFYDPDYPFRYIFEHPGIDIRAAQGTAVKASASGYVARAKRCSLASCYSYVMLVHADGLSTVYGHLSSIVVAEDKFVTRGDIIAYTGGAPGTAGAGPWTTGPHIHFEIRKNGIPISPLNYLIKDW